MIYVHYMLHSWTWLYTYLTLCIFNKQAHFFLDTVRICHILHSWTWHFNILHINKHISFHSFDNKIQNVHPPTYMVTDKRTDHNVSITAAGLQRDFLQGGKHVIMWCWDMGSIFQTSEVVFLFQSGWILVIGQQVS